MQTVLLTQKRKIKMHENQKQSNEISQMEQTPSRLLKENNFLLFQLKHEVQNYLAS